MPQLWLNNEFVDEPDASISVRDTGLLHAAGVFTTMKALGGRVIRSDAHLARLRNSCDAMAIPLPYDDGTLADAMTELLERNGFPDARMRLTITRGSARAEGAFLPTVLLTATELQPYPQTLYERGMTVTVVDDQKLNPYDAQAGHKTLNYLSRLLALRSANTRSAGEALWFDVHNYLQSGSISNVFIVKDGVITTPPTNLEMQDPQVNSVIPYPRSCVLPGVTRQAVIDAARDEGIELQTRAIDIKTLLAADEVFLTNSLMDVMPVCRIERQAIGNELPGKITLTIAQQLRSNVG